jgi:hypothetical protein
MDQRLTPKASSQSMLCADKKRGTPRRQMWKTKKKKVKTGCNRMETLAHGMIQCPMERKAQEELAWL